ncbi:MAG: L-lactate permease, partial [Bryobacteraceae bacterium]
MVQQDYIPVGNLAVSVAIAAIPIIVLLYLLGIRRTAAWVAALCGLGAALLVALFGYHMPPAIALSAVGYGAAFGLFPICWIIIWAIFLYRIMVETGKFKIVKDSIGNLTTDRRLQALLIAFAFGSFIEGAAGFGTPVAVAAAMLTGLGFSPFYASAICLLANTAPVAFGSVGVPIVTLAGITGLPLNHLSAGVGLICAPASLIVPAYVILVMGGWKALRGVLPAAITCGVVF